MLLILIQKRWICKEKKNRLFQSVSFSRDARGAGFRAKVTKGTSIGKKGEGDTFIEAAGWTCCKGTRGAVSMQGKVEIAGVNTARLKVLKNEETMALLRRTKEGEDRKSVV